jgi:hypothetical protein
MLTIYRAKRGRRLPRINVRGLNPCSGSAALSNDAGPIRLALQFVGPPALAGRLTILMAWGERMSSLKAIAGMALQSHLEFIVCGGFAVNAYQVIRKTGDIDLVIRDSEAESWKERLLSLGYSVFHDAGAFLQLRPGSPSSWPVDLIVVDDATFAAMKEAGVRFKFGDTECLIPSVEHLIAMKLHAIRSGGESRLRQDALDILDLAERARIDLEGDAFRQLCERYADLKIRDRILLYAGKSSS